MSFSEIVLGTVQFGMPYGLNRTLMTEAAVFRILDRAWEMGIRRLDTARGYGLAEERLGAWLARHPDRDPEIVTKFPDGDAGSVIKSVDTSLALLGRDRVHGLLAHDPATLTRPGLIDALAAYRDRVHAFGASVYDVTAARRTAELIDGAVLIQAPANPYDTRFADSGFLDASTDTRVVYRSIYLQGIIGLSPERLPAHLQALRPAQEILHRAAADMAIGPHAFAIAYVRHRLGLRDLVFGIAEPGHLDALAEGLAVPAPNSAIETAIRQALVSVPDAAIDPRVWPKTQ